MQHCRCLVFIFSLLLLSVGRAWAAPVDDFNAAIAAYNSQASGFNAGTIFKPGFDLAVDAFNVQVTTLNQLTGSSHPFAVHAPDAPLYSLVDVTSPQAAQFNTSVSSFNDLAQQYNTGQTSRPVFNSGVSVFNVAIVSYNTSAGQAVPLVAEIGLAPSFQPVTLATPIPAPPFALALAIALLKARRRASNAETTIPT